MSSSCSGCPSAPKDGSTCPSMTDGGSCSGGERDPKLAMQDQLISTTLDKIKNKIFVMSGKGGVGKSSVTVNLAAALAEMGYKVGILDVDIHGPSVPNLLGLKGNMDTDPEGRFIIPKAYSENLAVMSMDALLEDRDQAVLWRGPMKHSAIRQFVSDVDWGELDFLVIDSPPGTGDEHMTVLKTIPDAMCLVVTTPQEISLADVRKAVNFLQYANANVLGIVENMSGLICPHCQGEISLFKKGGGEELAKKYGVPFIGAVPLDPATVVAADMGRPVVLLEEDTPAKTALLNVAKGVVDALDNNLEAASTIHT